MSLPHNYRAKSSNRIKCCFTATYIRLYTAIKNADLAVKMKALFGGVGAFLILFLTLLRPGSWKQLANVFSLNIVLHVISIPILLSL